MLGNYELAFSLANKYNANIKAGKINYTNTNFTLDLQVSKKEINGKPFEQVEFENYAILYGFSKEDYNRTFNMNGKTFTLYGFKPRASKMPVLARGTDGKNYKFGVEIKRLLV
jgi:hypothetical protein